MLHALRCLRQLDAPLPQLTSSACDILRYTRDKCEDTTAGCPKQTHCWLLKFTLIFCFTPQDDYLDCFKIAKEAISSSRALWDRYFIDFTHKKLHMEYLEDSISNPLLKAAFSEYVDEGPDAEHRIVLLHVHFHVHQLELAKLAVLLRSLDRIKQIASTVPQSLKKAVEDDYIAAAKESKLIAGAEKDLAVFVIGTLFNTLEAACTNESSNLLQWYHTYNGVVSVDHLFAT